MINTRDYKEPILMFSGGKDSLLCLLMLQDQLDHINVVFVNTGKNFPEALSFIDTIKPLCKNFIELHSDRDTIWSRYGMPSDLVASKFADGIVNKHLTHVGGKMQSIQSCCYQSIMIPLLHLTKALGSTLIIRGNKLTDVIRDSIDSDTVIDGVTIYNPIEKLTDYQVLEALKTFNIELPDYYSFKETSLDCMDCTGFLDTASDRLALLKRRYPEEYKPTKENIEKIIAISEDTLATIKQAII